MKKPVYVALLLAMLTSAFSTTSYAGEEPYIGEITIFASNFAPRGYVFCEGQLLPISEHGALFSLLGTKYGGDGQTTFALPDLRKAEESLRGARYIIAMQGLYPSRR